ncbi:hypothetical protein KAH55_04165, partial [bacterium]|nr:hypothetical protein [bacterium]
LERESVMRRYYPKHWLPQDEVAEKDWDPNQIVNAQSGRFHYMWFDTQDTLTDWISASQVHQQWATRLMTEAFRRDDRMNTFAIHLFIDAFPAGWMKTIMDVERQPKPAYFAYRNALKPLMVSVRSDRWAYESGESITADAWICNDTHQIHKKTRLNYFLEIDGKMVQSGQAAAKISTCTSVCQGQLRFQAPAVKKRTMAKMFLGLVAESGDILADTEYEITLFPATENKELPQTFCLGRIAEQLAAELDLPRATTPGHAGVILISDRTEFTLLEKEVKQAVSQGAKAIFLELSVGTHTINGNTIDVKACGMNPRHFVSRKTGHALVRDLAPNDFRLWYDAAENCITPILHTTFSAKGWTPILTSGNGGWAEEWYPALAAAERIDGHGVWRICQLKLAGRIEGNPTAALFAQRLITE